MTSLKTDANPSEPRSWKRMLLVTVTPFERIVLCALLAWLPLYALYCCQLDRTDDARTTVLWFGIAFFALGGLRVWFSRGSTWSGWILAWGCFLVLAAFVVPWDNAKDFVHQLGSLIF
jgi:hypothetical protein